MVWGDVSGYALLDHRSNSAYMHDNYLLVWPGYQV